MGQSVIENRRTACAGVVHVSIFSAQHGLEVL